MTTPTDFAPFANSEQSLSIGEMTLENGTDEIGLYGDFRIFKGSARSKELLASLIAHLQAVHAAL